MQCISYPNHFDETLREAFEATKRIAIRCSMTENSSVYNDVFASKCGGIPYFPKNTEYPDNGHGVPLGFIAQVNLTELFKNPDIATAADQDPFLQHYPRQGMLSFFHNLTDDLYGLYFGNTPGNIGYRVLYFPEIITDESQLTQSAHKKIHQLAKEGNVFAHDGLGICSLDESYMMNFSLQETVFSYADSCISYNEAERDLLALIESNEIFSDISYDLVDKTNFTSHIGGYAGFIQSDPREDDEFNILLLQIDSNDGPAFGGGASMQLFINQDDLKKRDFTRVLYDWAC